MKSKFIIVVTIVICNILVQTKSIILTNGMRGIKVWCDTIEQFEHLKSFQYNSDIEFLKITPTVSDVVVPNDLLNWFISSLKKKQIRYNITINDMKKHINNKQKENFKSRQRRSENFFHSFPRYSEIRQYLNNMVKTNGDVMTLRSIGKSFENRDIFAVQISSGKKKDKKALLIDAGIHACEWIAPTSALYAIQELVTNPDNRYLFEKVDIYIIPLLNPDGYEFTHKNSTTRLWRKTRSLHNSCVGVDANRNFDFQWKSSNNSCFDLYGGPYPFSESETVALKNLFFEQNNIQVYLTLHSYGNFLMYPWAYSNVTSPNFYAHDCVAKKAIKEIKEVQNTTYHSGSITKILYEAYGGSVDWAHAKGGAELSYVMELSGEDYEFEPLPKAIEPIGEETFEAIKVLIDYMEGNICKNHR